MILIKSLFYWIVQFRFASSLEKCMLGVGILAAFCGGILSPMVNTIFGHFVQVLIEFDRNRDNNNTTGYVKCKSINF